MRPLAKYRYEYKQKRLLLCNLTELFALFKKKYPDADVELSKFCALRPKWCVTVGASGTHVVCVCVQHQNAHLLVDALKKPLTYKDLMGKVVCSFDNKNCMYGRCQKCPGKDNLRTYLDTIVENDKDHMIVKQWVTTDRADLITQMMSPDEFIDKCVQTIDELTTHSYVARAQSSYFSKA